MYRRLDGGISKISDQLRNHLLVNDCSPDNSIQVIQEIQHNRSACFWASAIRVILVRKWLFAKTGMELATMNSVVLLDGDLQDPPELIENFHVAKWSDGYDVVYGRRVRRDMPWYWGLMYKCFYRVFSAFSYIRIPRDAGDFSLMDRRVVGWLLQCTERDLFMRGLRAYVGFQQTGVDYIRPERMFGRSTNNFFKNIDWAKKGFFPYLSSAYATDNANNAGYYIFDCFCVVNATVVTSLKLFLSRHSAPKGVTTMLEAILIFGSLNLFAIGLVGEYVAKIMTEVKGRPRLIRSALIRNGKSIDLLPDGKRDYTLILRSFSRACG